MTPRLLQSFLPLPTFLLGEMSSFVHHDVLLPS